jgi:hypothetical protein
VSQTIAIISGYPESFIDVEGRSQTRVFYSFTVDGVPSLHWLPQCDVPGLPKDYYIQRTLNRLRSGRSKEAFGDAPQVAVDGVPVAVTSLTEDRFQAIESQLRSAGVPDSLVASTLRSLRQASGQGRGSVYPDPTPAAPTTVVSRGGQTKTREARPLWRYSLDQLESSETFPTEAAARAACALAAFMTRHKLGRLAEVQARLEAEFPGQACKVWVCPKEHAIRATVNGLEYLIAWSRVGDLWAVDHFKKQEPED